MLEPLSLENFDPVYAREPYLTTPRSLEACRHHGVNPEELVEIPFREFQRAYPDDPEIALRRFERVDTARKLMLESVYHKWQEICWEEEHRPGQKKKKSQGRECVIELQDGQPRLTVLEMQADRFRKVEQQQWKGLRNKLFMEMKKAIHDQRAKTIIEKQDNIGDTAKQRRKALELERERKMKADLEEADAKEREAAREVRKEQRAAMLEAKAKAERDKARIRREKRAQRQREEDRLAREEYRKSQKEDNYKRFRAEAIERSRQLDNQEKELAQRMKKERMKKEQADQQKKARTMKRLMGAKEELARQADKNRMKVTKSIEDFDKKVLKLREDKKAKWKEDLLKNSGRSLEHLNRVKQANKEKTEEKINSTMHELDRRDELAQQVFEENEAQRSRRRAIKEVRQQSFELAAIRRKKALDFRKEKLEESIRKKDERYQAIKDGEKVLKRMTESITEVISKTKMELTCQMDRLNSKDMLTTENVVSKVHEHNDTVLFPRLKNRFSHLEGDVDPAADTQSTRASTAGTTQSDATGGSEVPAVQQRERQEQDEQQQQQGREQTVDEADKGLASTLPAPVSKPMSQSRPGTSSLNKTTKTVLLRPKSPTTNLGLKVLSKNKINDTLSMMKLTLEETAAAKNSSGGRGTPKKKPPRDPAVSKKKQDADPFNLSGEQKPWLNGDDDHQEIVLDQQDEEFTTGGASAASSLEDERLQPPSRSDSSSGLIRKNTPFPEDLKPKGKAERKPPVPNEDAIFDELEEVEVDEEDIVARIEGTPKKKEKARPQTLSARPLTPDGKFRPEYSRDHPLAGGKGKYAKESQQGKQKLVPGKRREPPTPERLAEVMSKQEQKKYDLQRQLEDLRKHQNEALLEVLEDERKAEEQRTEMGRGVSDTKERNRLELIFTEERKRASERIIAMTKDHEQKMKQVIVAMDLGS